MAFARYCPPWKERLRFREGDRLVKKILYKIWASSLCVWTGDRSERCNESPRTKPPPISGPLKSGNPERSPAMEAPHQLPPDLDDSQLSVRTILEHDVDFMRNHDFGTIFDRKRTHQEINAFRLWRGFFPMEVFFSAIFIYPARRILREALDDASRFPRPRTLTRTAYPSPGRFARAADSGRVDHL
jgi:hypothetical protein